MAPLLLTAGIVLVVVAGASLGWYPSRLGGPAYWLDDHLYRAPLAFLGTPPFWPFSAGALFLIGLGLSFLGYALAARWGYRREAGASGDFWIVLLVQFALSAWLIVQPYLASQDIFSYAFYSHIYVFYHANPYVAVPRDFPFDPLFSAIFWKDQPSNYGPLWTYLSALAPGIAGTRTGPTLLVLKAITTTAAMGCTPLLWAILGRWRPERRVFGAVLFAWNPLVLLEASLSGHNDVVMAGFIAAGVWFWSRSWRSASVAALMLAALTKYVAILLVPLFVVAWLRARVDHPAAVLVRSGAIVLGLTVVGFAPLGAGVQTLGVIGFGTNPLAYTNSPMELAFRTLRVALGESADLADLPAHYQGSWLGTDGSTILWSSPDSIHATGIALPRGEPLLAVEPPLGEWQRVYEPRIGRFGYVQARTTRPIPAPRSLAPSATTTAILEGGIQDRPTQISNLLIRLVSASIFLPLYLLSLCRIRDGIILLRASVTSLFAYLVVVQTWFWPWYLLWALPLAALVPEALASQALFLLTLSTSLLNAQPSVSPPPVVEWLFEVRMLAIDGLPLLVVTVAWLRATERGRLTLSRLMRWVRHGRPSRWQLGRVLRPAGALALVVLLVGVIPAADVAGQPSPIVPPVVAWRRAFDEAQRSYSAGDFEAAVGALNEVLAARPDEIPAIRLRLAANLAMGRSADALPDLDRLLVDDPTNVDWLLERGSLALRVQRGDRAMADFRRVVDLAPANPAGYAGAGLVEYERGHLDLARDWFARALVLAPSDGSLARSLAGVFASAGEFDLALDLYNRAIQVDPTDAEAYAGRATVFQRVGLSDATVPDLRQVLVLTGDVQEHRWAERLLSVLAERDGAAISAE